MLCGPRSRINVSNTVEPYLAEKQLWNTAREDRQDDLLEKADEQLD